MQARFEFLTPVLDFRLSDVARTKDLELTGSIDTGFSEFLTLPPSKAKELGLKIVGENKRVMVKADGKKSEHWQYMGIITILGKEKKIPIIVLDDDAPILLGNALFCSLGLKMIYDFVNTELHFEESKQRPLAVSRPTVKKGELGPLNDMHKSL